MPTLLLLGASILLIPSIPLPLPVAALIAMPVFVLLADLVQQQSIA